MNKSIRRRKVERLDRIFSIYIRKRDCPNDKGKCISCNKPITFNTCDAGHYCNRKHMATRWDEQNVNAQCISCNRFDEGNIQGYRKGLITKIGEKTVDMLELKKFNVCKITDSELDILYNYYKNKIKEL